MELEECRPVDGIYQASSVECSQCCVVAQGVCRAMAIFNGRTITEIEQLIEEEDD